MFPLLGDEPVKRDLMASFDESFGEQSAAAAHIEKNITDLNDLMMFSPLGKSLQLPNS